MQPSVLDAWGLREIPWVNGQGCQRGRETHGRGKTRTSGSESTRTPSKSITKTSLTAKTAVGLLGPLLLLLM